MGEKNYLCTRCHRTPVRGPHTRCAACRAKARQARRHSGGGGGLARGGAAAVLTRSSFPVASEDYYRDQAARRTESEADDALQIADEDARADARLALAPLTCLRSLKWLL
jgi:hypothetical protein